MKTMQPRSHVLIIQRTLEKKTEKFISPHAYNSEGNTHEPWTINTASHIMFTHSVREENKQEHW
jgi:hypothetical protein